MWHVVIAAACCTSVGIAMLPRTLRVDTVPPRIASGGNARERAHGFLSRGAGTDTTAATPRAAVAVSGRIIDKEGGRPIAGAIIAIGGGQSTRSDVRGAWRLADVPEGERVLTARAVGYAPRSVRISVSPTMPAVTIELTRLTTQLDTVNVVDGQVTDRDLLAFLERRRTRGSGVFLTSDDITSRRAILVSDLFRSVQGGVRIDRDSLGNRYITMPSNTFQTPRCLPAIFIDGMSMSGLTATDLDGLLQPSLLFGIEVYRASNVPVEFSEQDGCGTILIWTKR